MCERVYSRIRNSYSRIYEIIGNFIQLFKKKPKVVPEITQSKESISVEITGSEEEASVAPPLLLLPKNIRKKIYDMLDYGSILTLSRTSRRILLDVGMVKGFQLYLGSDPSPHPITIRLGIESMRVDNYPQPLPTLPYPDLLKELIISGKIMYPISINSLLRLTPQLQVLRLISVARISKSRLLQNVTCPNLTTFVVDSVKEFPSLLNFVFSHHSSLTELQLRIHSTSSSPTPTNSIARKTSHLFPNLKHLSLSMDRISDDWKLLLNALHNLEHLSLTSNESLSWNDIGVGVVENCCNSLHTLNVVNLMAQMGSLVWPIDLSLLRHCASLRSLSLSHKPQTIFIPRVAHSSSLPPNIQRLSLAYFTLSPHQETTLLLKYPQLELLELFYWLESECKLAPFLSSLNFLLHLGLCSVKTVRLKELKSVVDRVDQELQSIKVHHSLSTFHIGDVYKESIITIMSNSGRRE